MGTQRLASGQNRAWRIQGLSEAEGAGRCSSSNRPAPPGRPFARSRSHVLAQLAQPRGRQIDPPQIGFDVKKRVIGQKDVGEAAFPPGLSLFPHAVRVLRTLDVEKPFCVVVEHQSDDRPGEEIRPQRTYGSVERREPLGNAVAAFKRIFVSHVSRSSPNAESAYRNPRPFPNWARRRRVRAT